MDPLPRTMCTQHPDNAQIPNWSRDGVIQGDDEIHEAYLAYSLYGCHEVMWDFEGKDVDIYVVRKLLTRYPEYFRNRVIGRDVYLTLRLPNPWAETAEKKVFSQALELIPTAYDVAREFYGDDGIKGVFQVILPLTSRAEELVFTYRYYERVVAGKAFLELVPGMKVMDVLGSVKPNTIDVIPLIEDLNSMLGIGKIIINYWRFIRPSSIRVFIARSDPAMNYGLIPAVLAAKIALNKALTLGRELGIEVYSIIGVGSTPFRGHLTPLNVDNVIKEYPCIITFTIQSAYRYDYPEDVAIRGITDLNNRRPNEECRINDQEALIRVIKKFMAKYQGEIEGLANIINRISRYIPPRRARKLHIGLFGYNRGFKGVILPRAITFVASLYSLGIPPEILGFSAMEELSDREYNALRDTYVNLVHDLSIAAGYVCHECLDALMKLDGEFGIESSTINAIKKDIETLEEIGIKTGPNNYETKKHELLAQLLINSIIEGKENDAAKYAMEMAQIRHAIG
ncbi:phosphoenolpyruvate carboxylase [Vulcanisaeta souniana]|uniref:Phosphoenolpyruvate carboxylase n=1 Tax=Vulcanisaeta souniana JCM 11219 TaxID=1293586 RepID=A0A830ELH4_9CREN|nr:phosphoenolpyruvate carboxylase [Vulcanisaeta souniana]BDR92534.1 phosphoenolpyruvate carboxylase [Vulcanisaeta souniana JCM 11219]GGI83091.1 phosphoenolpyruvate carboxylase [Vulcanisaeta souniana JCM 11219]